MKIPIFHLEAGNRSFDQRIPEENNRVIVDHMSDINLTYSTIAREYLLREGLNPYQVIKVGSPMKEVINFYLNKANKSNILKKLKVKKDYYYLVSFHREENVENKKRIEKFFEIINFLSLNKKYKVVISTHFRTQNKFNELKYKFPKIVISDSGTITEESSILNLNAISLRSTHERPEGMEEGSLIFNDLDLNKFKTGIHILENDNKNNLNIIKDYDVKNVSSKVVKIIISYIDYVNNVVWKKK